MLYEKQADINIQDGQGRTAVHLAAWHGSLENFHCLKDNNSDLELKDYQGTDSCASCGYGRKLRDSKDADAV